VCSFVGVGSMVRGSGGVAEREPVGEQ
jgi:hypothetical protein